MTGAALPGLIYEAAVDAARWPAVLAALSEEFAAVAGVLVLTDAVRSDVDLAVASGRMADPALQAQYQRDWAHRDPGLAAFSRMAAGRIAITSQLWPTPEERQAIPFYRDFYQPNGLSDSLCVCLAQGESRKGLLALMRGRGAPDFDGDDARRLKLLTPHLQRALQLHEEIVERTRREGSFSAAAERLAAGLVVLDPSGVVVAANAAARRLAARDDGVSLVNDRLAFPHDPEAAALCRALAQGHGAGRAGEAGGGPEGAEGESRRLLRRAGEALPYGLTVAPLPPPPGALRAAGGALVTITEPRAPSPRSVAVVARHFGLTPGEAGLLQSILEGRSLGDHASARGLTPHAARFHAKRVFAKADVRSQADLVRVSLLLASALEGGQA